MSAIRPFDPAEIEALRRITLFLRDHVVARAAIAANAQVSNTHLDNFLNRTAPGKSFRLQRPRPPFLYRMLNYIFSDSRILVSLEQNRDYVDDLATLKDAMLQRAKLYTGDDHTFHYLKSLKATNDGQCKSICDNLTGHYELYRLSADPPGDIHKSYMTVDKYNIYRKVPRFTNKMVLEDGSQRVVDGSIVELGQSYMFFGYVRKDGNRPELGYRGSKVMILRKLTRPINTLMGFFYTSGSEEIYNVGAVRVIKTKKDTFDPTICGKLPLNMASESDIQRSFMKHNETFPIRDLALFFGEDCLIGDRIYASLDFDLPFPRRELSPGRKRGQIRAAAED